jgi:hypothetical protein
MSTRNKKTTGNAICVVHSGIKEPIPQCLEEGLHPEVQDFAVDRKTYRIRLADSEEHRNSASMLINKMYSWRGYSVSDQITENPNLITLVASDDYLVIGTITLAIDSPIGLLADETYKDEIDIIRSGGRKICEFIKLAVDPGVHSKRILAALFHVAFIYAWYIQKSTDLLIEVNPRHQRFYERMLGFKRHGEIRNNPRVNAPAVLLWLDLGYAYHQIQKFGGKDGHLRGEKSLYPYFFSPHEEEGIAHRLLDLG